jgi:hypothetical protein
MFQLVLCCDVRDVFYIKSCSVRLYPICFVGSSCFINVYVYWYPRRFRSQMMFMPFSIKLFPMFHYIVLNIIYICVCAIFVDIFIRVLFVRRGQSMSCDKFLSNPIAVLFAIK